MDPSSYVPIAFLLLFSGGMIAYAINRTLRQVRRLGNIARDLGFNDVEIQWMNSTVSGQYSSLPASISLSSGEHSAQYIRLRLSVSIPGQLLIQKPPGGMERWFGQVLREPIERPPRLLLSNSSIPEEVVVYADSGFQSDAVRVQKVSRIAERIVHDPEIELCLNTGELILTRPVAGGLEHQIPWLWSILVEFALALGASIRSATKPLNQDAVCPFCRDEIREQDATWLCSECNAVHHVGCWRENGRCSAFGCNGQPTNDRAKVHTLDERS
jgi:RING finger family protein